MGMLSKSHPEIENKTGGFCLESVVDDQHTEILRSSAADLARDLAWLPTIQDSRFLVDSWHALARRLEPLLAGLQKPLRRTKLSDDYRWLHDNLNLLSAELQNTGETLKSIGRLPHVRTGAGEIVPRVFVIAESFLTAADYRFTGQAFISYLDAFQERTPLNMAELWTLVSTIKLVLLEQLAGRAARVLMDPETESGAAVCIRSLRDLTQAPWKEIIEPLIPFDRALLQDPAGAYPRMDFESRDLYRNQVANLAARSDFTELEVAFAALAFAKEASQATYSDPRLADRCSHIGYYLVSDGADLLKNKLGFRPTIGQRVQSFLKEHPDEFYLPAIEVLTFSLMSAIVLLLTSPYCSPLLVLMTMLALFLPSSQSAVQVVNYLATSLLKPKILPKIDMSGGIPDDCITMVAVPTLLLNENQVRRLVDQLEIRFLGNQDKNLHFALVSDLPDSASSASEDDPLIDLCSDLISRLNEKYAGQRKGSFFLFHRHRVYNRHEQVWMGWERKRGKLLDLNRLLRSQHDSFPVKVGDLTLLSDVRFVITLDSDTELPRGSAHRMIGALSHPLNQAIIDPDKNIVIAGYGILQPRVGVSVQSASRSRLAKIYSGQTGFDIYTRAVSDVYQDLYGEGTFAGKGIYEVDILRRVLEDRFPNNALLSHDLIEGAYARVGLVTDIEIIEDYPSHYSAYNRRKHRWLRGDWQVAEWLAPTVRGASSGRVRNPISTVSRWKILDNLRRGLVEPATFLLLVLGWVVFPGSPRSWTLAAFAILFVPAWCRFLFEVVRSFIERKSAIARDAVKGLLAANVTVFLTLTFLAHQMLLSMDAMVRALVRRIVTGRRLLEWETAAEAEARGLRRTALDAYLDWTPALAVGLAILVLCVRRSAFLAAFPILALWACSKLVSVWLNLPLRVARWPMTEKDRMFLRGNALRTWRYFSEFSTEEHNWLIPDNVQEGEPLRIAARVSPTNIGLLLNARQAACRFGYLTIPEFIDQTHRTLATIARLGGYRGHLFNWYDTRTLEPLLPRFVSSVDSGNLVAALWTLEQGCLEQLRSPLLQHFLADGLLDYLYILRSKHVLSRRQFLAMKEGLAGELWLQRMLSLPDALFENDRVRRKSKRAVDASWLIATARMQVKHIRDAARLYVPWLFPEFDALRSDPAVGSMLDSENAIIERLPALINEIAARLELVRADPSKDQSRLAERLLALLPEARRRALRLVSEIRENAADAGNLARKMDFAFLLNGRRKLLSVGYEVETRRLSPSCYDLLASEARIALFVAIAKNDVSQESWFQLGRPHTLDRGRPMLLSWTGTMFEYLMPSIWMRSYADTLLERSRVAAVRAHRRYAATRGIPWGISESAYARKDDSGNYRYYAFGIPLLAVKKSETDELVISPYSTFLALQADPIEAVKNLHKMHKLKWTGAYGFYDAAEFSPTGPFWRRNHEVVRCWMAHHQGMSLLSMANLLCDGVSQRWFHANPQVQATELLLQEKPVAYVRPAHERYRAPAA
jgi:hypothetical protein